MIQGTYEVNSLITSMSPMVDDPAMADINREMIPILLELLTLGQRNYEHPADLQLSKWLLDPRRTGEEWRYVLGPLHNHGVCRVGARVSCVC